MLFDLAYFKYRRFALIDENDGYFVSRLKQKENPVITKELRERGGDAIRLEGKQIHDVVYDLYRTYIDVEAEAEFKRGLYNSTRSVDTKQFRVVGVSFRTSTTTISTSRTSHEKSFCRQIYQRCIDAVGS